MQPSIPFEQVRCPLGYKSLIDRRWGRCTILYKAHNLRSRTGVVFHRAEIPSRNRCGLPLVSSFNFGQTGKLRYYFDVSNAYVFNKLKILLLPIRHKVCCFEGRILILAEEMATRASCWRVWRSRRR